MPSYHLTTQAQQQPAVGRLTTYAIVGVPGEITAPPGTPAHYVPRAKADGSIEWIDLSGVYAPVGQLALDTDGVYYPASQSTLLFDTDGVPYYSAGAAPVARIAIDTDDVPYPVAIGG